MSHQGEFVLCRLHLLHLLGVLPRRCTLLIGECGDEIALSRKTAQLTSKELVRLPLLDRQLNKKSIFLFVI